MTDHFLLAVAGQSLIKRDIRSEIAPAFKAVQELLRQADLAFTNFEGTVLGRYGGWPLKGSFFGCSSPLALDALKATGFKGLSLSNNHAFDLGPSGILSTLEEVETRGFLHGGIGRNLSEVSHAQHKLVADRDVALLAMDGGPGPDFMYAADAVDGRPERPGVNRLKLSQILELGDDMFQHVRALRDQVGYTAIDLTNDSQPDDPPTLLDHEVGIGRTIFARAAKSGRNVRIDPSDLSRNLSAIRQASKTGALVIAYLHHHHWASDWYQVPGWVGAVARQCIDAGAALFLSHGAPVLQPIEIYRGRPIFYSLGNFIFHVRSQTRAWHAPEVWESVVATCSFNQKHLLEQITLHPIVIGGDQALANPVLEDRLVPHLATGRAADRILSRLAAQSAGLGVEIEICGEVGRITWHGNSSETAQGIRSSA